MKSHIYLLILLLIVFISVFEDFNQHAADPQINVSEVPILKTNAVWRFAYAPDGKTLLVSGAVDVSVWLWDPKTGKLLNTLSGHTTTVTRVRYAPDGQTFVSRSSDGTVFLWRMPAP